MADIFISYKSERRAAARHLEQILINYGYSVWFDHALVRGTDYEAQIENEIRQAEAVVVLWCDLSVKSEPVRSEANWAKGKGKLIPLKIKACEMPLFSTLTQRIDMTAASCSPRDSALDPLIDDIERLVGRAPQPDYKALREYEATWRAMGALTFAGFPLEAKASREVVLALDDELPPEPTPPPRSAEDAYAAIKGSDDPADWEKFVADYPDSGLAIGARARARQLRAQWEKQEHAAKNDSHEAEAAEVWRLLKDCEDSEAVKNFLKRYEGTAAWTEAVRDMGYVVAHVGYGESDDEQHLLKPGDTFKDAEFAPEMVVVPPGSFMMGSKDGEGIDDERPPHDVTIAQPFAVSCVTVTLDQFDTFIKHNGCDMSDGAICWTGIKFEKDDKYSWLSPGFIQGYDHPVVCVNWADAQAYIEWLRKHTGGKSYRLLSEAEWEYCCRAGTTTAYSTGGTITSEQANFGQNEKGTTPVKKYGPNDFGLHDMHGNVWEWCQDNWHKDYGYDPPRDGSVWQGGDASFRVVRGGAWSDRLRYLRSANRDRDRPTDRNSSIGFRLARTLTP